MSKVSEAIERSISAGVTTSVQYTPEAHAELDAACSDSRLAGDYTEFWGERIDGKSWNVLLWWGEAYQTGYVDGYEAFRRGSPCGYRCVDSPPRVVDDTGATVSPEELDFARGHIDGWMRAADDAHD